MGSIHAVLSKEEQNNLQSLSLVWLDDSMKDANEYDQLHEKIRTVINQTQSFQDPQKCKKYIKSLSAENQIVFLVNNQLAGNIVERIHRYRQVFSIYIHIRNQTENEQWTHKFPKVNNTVSKI